MKPFLIISILLIAIISLYSQVPSWQWAIRGGGSNSDFIRSIARDANGYIYIAGGFTGPSTFGGIQYPGYGNIDIFVAKLTPDGQWVWLRTAGGTALDNCTSLAVDSLGNVYIAGYYHSTATFGNFSISCGAAYENSYVAKLSETGHWMWVVSSSSISSCTARNLVLDNHRNVLLGGYFSGTATFGDFSLTAADHSDAFVTKLSTDGVWQWAVKTDGGGESCYNIAADSSGNTYICGGFTNSLVLGSITLTGYGTSGSDDIYVAKLDSLGNWIWAVKAGGDDYDYAFGITVDSTENLRLGGSFISTADFGGWILNSGSVYMCNVFVAKLDSDGNWIWAVQGGGSDIESCGCVDTDTAGNTYISGYYYGTAIFGTYSLVNSGQYDAYIAKLDSAGNWLWAIKAGGNNYDSCNEIDCDNNGFAYTVGYFNNIAHFGTINLTSAGDDDVFIAKVGYYIGVDDQASAPVTGISVSCYPNPVKSNNVLTFTTKSAYQQAGNISIFNQKGQLVRRLSLERKQTNLIWNCTDANGKSCPAGVYLYRFRSGNKQVTQKLLIIK